MWRLLYAQKKLCPSLMTSLSCATWRYFANKLFCWEVLCLLNSSMSHPKNVIRNQSPHGTGTVICPNMKPLFWVWKHGNMWLLGPHSRTCGNPQLLNIDPLATRSGVENYVWHAVHGLSLKVDTRSRAVSDLCPILENWLYSVGVEEFLAQFLLWVSMKRM